MKKLILLSLIAITIKTQAQNVGIGTPTPATAYKLHVHADFPITDASIGITNSITTDGNLRGARLRQNASDFILHNYEATGKIKFSTNFNERMTIAPNGYVGIGSHDPTYAFDVRNNTRGSLFMENPITTANATVRILRGYDVSDPYETAGLNVKASGDYAGVFGGLAGIKAYSGDPLLRAAGLFIGNTVQSAGIPDYTGDGIALELVGGIKISSGTNKPIFTHVTTAINNSLNTTKLSYLNPLATDFLMVTPNYQAGPVYNNHPIGVYFDGTTWRIFNQDSVTMPVGTAFNVMVIRQ
jgi:hypothetical protein